MEILDVYLCPLPIYSIQYTIYSKSKVKVKDKVMPSTKYLLVDTVIIQYLL